jgi:hypothetical protein
MTNEGYVEAVLGMVGSYLLSVGLSLRCREVSRGSPTPKMLLIVAELRQGE